MFAEYANPGKRALFLTEADLWAGGLGKHHICLYWGMSALNDTRNLPELQAILTSRAQSTSRVMQTDSVKPTENTPSNYHAQKSPIRYFLLVKRGFPHGIESFISPG